VTANSTSGSIERIGQARDFGSSRGVAARVPSQRRPCVLQPAFHGRQRRDIASGQHPKPTEDEHRVAHAAPVFLVAARTPVEIGSRESFLYGPAANRFPDAQQDMVQ
jgi:hypothetical protein